MLADIIQIATRQQIFIIDVLALTENGQVDVPTSTENGQLLSHQQGRILMTKLFANADVCKLLFGKKCDLQAIAISLPGCEDLTNYTSQSNVVDLQSVYNRMKNAFYSHLLPYKGTGEFCIFCSKICHNITNFLLVFQYQLTSER